MNRSPATPQALYRKAKSFVLEKIRSKQWNPGDMIPSENQLVIELGMSRMTVNRALRELTDEGQLTRISGVGTFIAEVKPQSNLLMISNIADEILARGHSYSFRIVQMGRESAPLNVAASLELPTGSSVFRIICVHFEDELPVQFEDRYVNPALVPEFLSQTFDNALQPAQYLLDNIPADEMEHIVDATMPTTAEANALSIDPTDPCLVLIRRTWSKNVPVTFVRLLHPSSRYRLGSRFTLSAGNRSR